MSCKAWRERTYDAETRRLKMPREGGRRCRGGQFPWQALWLIWPLMFLLKGAGALMAPALAWLSQPILLSITPLPLLLIGAGVALLLVGRRREL